MPEITSIEPQKNDKTRCSVFIDGRFYCGLKLEVAVKYRLKTGMHIEKSELDEMQAETEKSVALDKALTHISDSMKTEKQIRDFLAKKGYVEAIISFVVEKMKSYGYIDDEQYCRAYISGSKGKSRRQIEAKLISVGVDRQAVDAALEDFEEDEREVVALLEKYLRGKQRSRENLNKGIRYLVGKGYSFETAKSAVEKLDEGEDYQS